MSAACLHGSSSRRGSVLVMVVAVLAMLFIIGSTQLMMARFERRLSEEKSVGTQAKETAGSAVVPPAVNIGEDARGVDGLAYSRAWNPAETSPIEDGADTVGTPTFASGENSDLRIRKAARAGDLLLSSLEPYSYLDTGNNLVWTYPFMSWSKDAITDSDGSGYIEDSELPGSIEIGTLPNGTPASPVVGGSPLKNDYHGPGVGDYYRDTMTNRPCADIDGDGIVDGRWVGSMAGCDLYQRIISHGGMVTMDRMTHPALLAQVIHPRDLVYGTTNRYYHNEPWTLFDSSHSAYWNGTFTDNIKKDDEGRLRRRFMLPGSTQFDTQTPVTDWMKLPDGDLRKLLPYTLGYRALNDDIAPHYWRVGSPPDGVNRTAAQELNWWQSRIVPGYALTEKNATGNPIYNASTDTYDRRHLLTTHSNDDLLRPNRDEKRLLQLPSAGGAVPVTTFQFGTPDPPNSYYGTSLYYVLNPESETGLGAFNLDKQARTAFNGPPMAYGTLNNGTSWSLEFNKPGLRTPFSLRDALVRPNTNLAVDSSYNVLGWGYQASYRRCVQLISYYLAMIQHTTVQGSNREYNAAAGTTNPTPEELAEQLKTAAQLAVNTIDFADNADVTGDGAVTGGIGGDIVWDTNGDSTVITDLANPLHDIAVDPVTCFSYSYVDSGEPPVTHQVEVFGFEKQPFITEAYVKYAYEPDPPDPPSKTDWTWQSTPSPESIYAVELYNPYSETLFLDDFILRAAGGDVDLMGAYIPPQSYIVIANRLDDPSGVYGAGNPFIDGAITVKPTFPPADKFQPFKNLYVDITLKLDSTGASLLRKTALRLEINAGIPVARLDRMANVVVDQLMPSGVGVGTASTAAADTNAHALDFRFAGVPVTDVAASLNPARAPDGATDRLVWDSSLQRRKPLERDLNDNVLPYSYPPGHWQFTLSHQVVFPLPWYEHPSNIDGGTGDPVLFTKPTRLAQHNLLGTYSWTSPTADGALTNQQIVALEMDGIQYSLGSVSAAPAYPEPDKRTVYSNVVPYRKYPIAPCPLVTSDLGLDAAGRCRAFPTTGTILLVSRYANVQFDGAPFPATLAAARVPLMDIGTNRYSIMPIPPYASPLTQFDGDYNDAVGQMQMLDNGHLPIFDGPRYNGPFMTATTNPGQIVLGTSAVAGTPGEPRHTFMPWGQLVFSYFTALPIEELFVYRNLSAVVTGATNVRAVDLTGADYDNAYKYIVNGMLVNDYLGSNPVVEALAAGGSTTVGPRVRGRVNINSAPWWVLDGLPVLPDQYLLPGHVDYGLFNGLPVPELVSGALDAAVAGATSAASQTLQGVMVQDPVSWATRFTDDATRHNAGASTLGPDMAALMVAYRENRSVRNVSVTQMPPALQALANSLNVSLDSVGFVGPGALCDLVQRMPVSPLVMVNGAGFLTDTPLGNLRQMLDPSVTAGPAVRKPYSYFGYLQMIAPIVRLQDWVTTKSHVYTVYNLVGDGNGTWLRSQTTIDRTRCLYTNDLPDKITATDPINYFNVMGDQ